MKTLVKVFATALVLAWTTGSWAQTTTGDQTKLQIRQQLQDGSCNDDCDGTPDQIRDRTQLKTHQTTDQQALMTQTKAAFRASLTSEQLEILENKQMTREQKQTALKASLSEAQQQMLQAQQQFRLEQKSHYGNGVAEGQLQQLRQRIRQTEACENQSAVQEQVQQQTQQQLQQCIQEQVQSGMQEQTRQQAGENASGYRNGHGRN